MTKRNDRLHSWIARAIVIVSMFVVSLSFANPIYADCDAANFKGARDVTFGQYPYAIVSGDFNSDGKADIAAADYYGNSARVAFGDGAGGFSSSSNFLTGTKPSGIAVGDLNNDGKLDLVVANYDSNNLSVLLGNGAGNFSITNFPAGISPRSIALGDFNGDTKLDVAVTNTTVGQLQVLLNNGSGGLGSPAFIQLANFRQPTTVVTADFNNDTKLDLATTDNPGGQFGGISVFMGGGTGIFGSETFTTTPTFQFSLGQTSDLKPIDFNNDGFMDLIVLNFQPGGVRILFGNNAGSFLFDNPTRQMPSRTYELQLKDVNSDNKLDIVVVGSPTRVYLADGFGGTGATQDIIVGNEPRTLAVTDLNGDGMPDIITSFGDLMHAGLTVSLNSAIGKFDTLSSIASGGGFPVLSDFNLDGRLDLAIGGGGTLKVQLGLPSGDFSAPVSYPAAVGHIAVGDFNGDGRPDIAGAGSTNLSVLINNGSGGFGSPQTYTTAGMARAVAIGQFSADNFLDIAVATSNTRVIRLFTGNGLGGFALTGNFSFAASPYALVTGDFNNDGRADLISTNYCDTSGGPCSTKMFTLLPGLPAGGFGTHIELFSISTWNDAAFGSQILAASDFNGDGKLDLAFTRSPLASNAVDLALNIGGGNFAPPTILPGAEDSNAIMFADVNNDGRPDLIGAGGSVSSEIRIHLNNGSGGFEPVVAYAGIFNGGGLAVGDTNGDGKRDIIMTADAVYRLVNRCALSRGAHTSDFDGDGITDISVFRPSTGFWYFINSSNGSFHYVPFGTNGDIPVPGDYDGDGKSDVAVFRPSAGTWYYLRSSDGSFQFTQFGTNGDVPLPGDFDGDGISNFAVFRPSTGYWYTSTNPAINYGAVLWGQNGDTPVPADYDGDGRTDIAVFRPSTAIWYLLRSAQGYQEQQFGLSTDVPVPSDYDGDGRANFAVFRPATGFWYTSTNPAINYGAIPLGQSGDVPAAGYYDADGNADAAVFRAGDWYIFQSTTSTVAGTHFGASGDVPTPPKAVP